MTSLSLFALAGSLFRATTPNTTWFHGCLATDRKCPCSIILRASHPSKDAAHAYILHMLSLRRGHGEALMWQPVDGWGGSQGTVVTTVVGLRNPKGVAIHRLDGSSKLFAKNKKLRRLAEDASRSEVLSPPASPLTRYPPLSYLKIERINTMVVSFVKQRVYSMSALAATLTRSCFHIHNLNRRTHPAILNQISISQWLASNQRNIVSLDLQSHLALHLTLSRRKGRLRLPLVT
ncbi:hypothetical protein BKA82DRAFT_3503521 [Pisolithus tinctorius]|nr:hypothetical protein BKA82DRAFT_3503521 [Pisolithus tinctorius]